jgi:hypothetical protein
MTPARSPVLDRPPGRPSAWGRYLEVKDPCPVHDGRTWHLYGTGITAPHRFEILHATSSSLEGPWRLGAPAQLPSGLTGGCLAAPGVVAEGAALHMFLQTEYNVFAGRIEHLVSLDGGNSFAAAGTALSSVPGGDEAGIYDPHPATIGGERYLVYSAFAAVGEPDLYLARSRSGDWDGPWQRLGAILRHEEVAFHNRRGSLEYEWGLEGAQLLELPDGRVLLTAVCFLADGPPGARQRVFLGVADDVAGPYAVSGPLIVPEAGPLAGENGHATAVLDEDGVTLLYQERDGNGAPWRYALARIDPEELP